MFLKDVLNKCREEGYPITSGGLYYAGKKYGFLVKKDGKNLDFNKDKFFEWLHKAKEEIPEGWVSLNQLHNELGISLSQAYILSKDPKSEARTFGAGPGVVYVNIERIRAIINERKRNHQENWEE